MLVNKTYTEKINELSKRETPFLFIIDYAAANPLVFQLDKIPDDILFSTPGYPDKRKKKPEKELSFKKMPSDLSDYKIKFNALRKEIIHGNSFLANLTLPTKIVCNWSLEDIYFASSAKYKLLIKDKLIVFSPETFVTIDHGKIATYPMKGTIDAAIPDAEQIILADEKESSEHYTIVDLMRNDLSQIATHIEVEKFRYIDRIKTHEKEILQVSSKISGKLPVNFENNLGDLLFKLLPAGSISGAPKRKTVEILQDIENYDRGFYTGVFGVFDGKNLDSAVMIRYIEKTPNGLVYKSGGGITHRSIVDNEYCELMDKVYVPIT